MTSNNGSKKSKSGYAKKIKGVFGFGKSKSKVQVVNPPPGTAPERNPVLGKKEEAYIQDPKKETSPAKGKIPGAPAGVRAKGNSKGQAKSGSMTPVEGPSPLPSPLGTEINV